MTDTDQTVVLPRQRVTVEAVPRPDPWQVPARGSAPVGGLANAEAALTRLAWVLTTVLMGTAALVRAGWSSLSTEELTTWALANTSWTELWQLRTEIDAGSAAYYGLVRASAELLGTGEFSLRLPSIVAMVVAAGASAALVSRLVGPRAGVLAGLLFVAVPATSRYAHEAGPQALLVAFAVLSTLALVSAFERPRPWQLVGYGAAVALLGLAHTAGLLLLLGHACAVLALRRRVLPWWGLAALVGAAPGVGMLFVARPPWQVPPWLAPAGAPSVTEVAATLFGVALLGGVMLGLSLLALSLRKPAGVFTAVALAPLLGLYPASEFTGLPVSLLLLFTLPGWLGLAAMALHRAPLVRGLTVVGLVALVGLPAQLGIRADDGHALAGWQVGQVLNERVEAGDAIMFGPAAREEQIGRDLVARYVAEPARPEDVLAQTPPRTEGRWLAQECADVDACLGEAPRVWLLRADAQVDPLDGLPAAKDGALRVRYELARSWTLRGASLHLFTLVAVERDEPAS